MYISYYHPSGFMPNLLFLLQLESVVKTEMLKTIPKNIMEAATGMQDGSLDEDLNEFENKMFAGLDPELKGILERDFERDQAATQEKLRKKSAQGSTTTTGTPLSFPRPQSLESMKLATESAFTKEGGIPEDMKPYYDYFEGKSSSSSSKSASKPTPPPTPSHTRSPSSSQSSNPRPPSSQIPHPHPPRPSSSSSTPSGELSSSQMLRDILTRLPPDKVMEFKAKLKQGDKEGMQQILRTVKLQQLQRKQGLSSFPSPGKFKIEDGPIPPRPSSHNINNNTSKNINNNEWLDPPRRPPPPPKSTPQMNKNAHPAKTIPTHQKKEPIDEEDEEEGEEPELTEEMIRKQEEDEKKVNIIVQAPEFENWDPSKLTRQDRNKLHQIAERVLRTTLSEQDLDELLQEAKEEIKERRSPDYQATQQNKKSPPAQMLDEILTAITGEKNPDPQMRKTMETMVRSDLEELKVMN